MNNDLGKFYIYDETEEFGVKSKEETPSETMSTDEVSETKKIEKACERVKSKKPLSLKKVAKGGLIIGVGAFIILISSCSVNKHKKKMEPIIQQAKFENQYETMLSNDNIRTSTFYQLIDEPTSSLDDLINKDKTQYEAYEKFRNMLRAKEQFIDPKMTNLQNYEVNETVVYANIDEKDISELNDLYYEYYKLYIDAETANDMVGYAEYKAKFDEVCVQLISANHAINFYQEKEGNQLVMDIASKVLASKVIDTDGEIIAAGVSDIHGEYNEDGTMSVTFKYDDFGKTVRVTSDDFQNQGYDLVENLAKDLAENNNLRAIHETKILANDSNYIATAQKESGFGSK